MFFEEVNKFDVAFMIRKSVVDEDKWLIEWVIEN